MKDKEFSVRKITFLALITASAIVGRTLFQSIPNVQPVTDIILLLTIAFGIWEGFSVALLTILITNLYMGMGIWTVFQIVTYGVIILLTYFLRPLLKKHFLIQVGYSFVVGILYGFIISLLYALFFMGIDRLIPYYLAGLSFDLMHGIGNGAIYIVFIPILNKLIDSYFKKEKSI